MIWKVAGAVLVTLVAACSNNPTPNDIQRTLQERTPDAYKGITSVRPVQTEMNSEADNTVLVKFKAEIVLTEPLYMATDFSRAAQSAGVDMQKYGLAESALRSMPRNLRESVEAEAQRLLKRPTFIEQTTPGAATSEWYGSYRTKKVVDKWVITEFHTHVMPAFKGVAKASLPADALTLQDASGWFSNARRDYELVFQRAADAQRVQQAEQRAAQAQAIAEQMQAEARKMPVNVGFRRAALDGSMVLRMQATAPITATLSVSRGHQSFRRDIQLAPGKTTELGHLEGWGFRSGDRLTLTNSSFDSLEFLAP